MALYRNSTTRSGFRFTHNGKVYDFASIYVSKSEVLTTDEVSNNYLYGIGKNDPNTKVLGRFPSGNSIAPYGPNYVFDSYNAWDSSIEIERMRWTWISMGDNHAGGVINGKIMLWGKNDWQQLGDGTLNDRTSLTPAPLLPISADNWKIVECGYKNTAAIADSGKLYMWGYNAYSKCANTNLEVSSTITFPTQVGSSTNWDYVFCGYYATYGIQDGVLYQWGRTDAMLYGDQNAVAIERSIPVVLTSGINDGKRVKKVVAVKEQPSPAGMVLFEDGTILQFGYRPIDSLAIGLTLPGTSIDAQSGYEPLYLDSEGNQLELRNIIDIAISMSHSLALKQDGTIWGWGNNTNGELGYPTSGADSISTATYATLMNRKKSGWNTYGYRDDGLWQRVGCTNGTSYGIKTDGQLWATGYNSQGQCGNANLGGVSIGWNKCSSTGREGFTKISCAGYSSLIL